MKLAIIVTEFPCTTETFIMRDVVQFIHHGHDVRLYHLLPYNHSAKLHDFAKVVVARAHRVPFLSSGVVREVFRTMGTVPRITLSIIGDLVRFGWRDPQVLVKSLGIVPQSIAMARELREWGADHIHGEFAGNPTTCAWGISRLTGISYSASCRAHDVFVSQALLGLTLSEAAAVRTISQYNIDFLRARVPQLREKPMTVIHSSVDLTTISVVARAHGVFSILYVGSLSPRKGVDDLLHALAHFDPPTPWQLVVIGDGPERRKLERLTSTLKLVGNVTFLGAQRFEDVSSAYAACDVLVAPSRYGKRGRTEGIPNVVIEALAHERPVITTRVSGIPELVENRVTGFLVAPNDRTALTEALYFVQQHPDVADATAKQGRLRVEEQFDLIKNAATQLDLFISTAQQASL